MSDTRSLVYAGPSLRPSDIREFDRLATGQARTLEWRPPVRRHDLLALGGDSAIRDVLILDGEFGQRLSVSVAEVRSVLASGMRILGASSMGALRAVECGVLGMKGCGWVYRQYLTGAIASDGEVALLFDPDDYAPVTVPLVNVRWLLHEKAVSGLLAPSAAEAALTAASSVSFRYRRLPVLLKLWKEYLRPKEVEVLEAELTTERYDSWDRKRLDGIHAVRMILGLEGREC